MTNETIKSHSIRKRTLHTYLLTFLPKLKNPEADSKDLHEMI